MIRLMRSVTISICARSESSAKMKATRTTVSSTSTSGSSLLFCLTARNTTRPRYSATIWATPSPASKRSVALLPWNSLLMSRTGELGVIDLSNLLMARS
jgi:hypothetical protein